MSLQVTDLACSRSGQLLFSGIGLALGPGSIAHVRGPNGSGKSSLLLALAGILPPARGTVLWNGEPMFSECVAYAGHLDGLKPALTLRENLVAWARILGADPAQVPFALEALGISHCSNAPAGRCSAGQRRRAALARVLVAARPIWLLDEPSATLDPTGNAILSDLLRQHQDTGGIALIATHDLLPPEPGHVVDIGQARAPASVPDDALAWLL